MPRSYSQIGQAIYATGVGQAMMIAYGAYIDRGTSLVRTSLAITGSILLVSLLATMMIFPLVFGYGLDPAQGPELVFKVLPRVFTEMPGGRFLGTLFSLLLVLAALMPSIVLLEPAVVWLIQRRQLSRTAAVWWVAASAWVLGTGSALSFNLGAHWYPLSFIPVFAHRTFFDVLDYGCSNILLPLGALLTSMHLGWRLKQVFAVEGLAETTLFARTACVWLLQFFVPAAILAVFIAAVW